MKAVLLNKRSLELAKLAPKGESRFTLNAIQVTGEETVVTNGHYLVRVEHAKAKIETFPKVAGDVETVESKSFLIGRDAALELSKAIPKASIIPILSFAKVGLDAEGQVRAITTDLETHRPMAVKKVTGSFPNWQAVIPKTQPKLTIYFNGCYLAELAKMAAVYQERSGCIRLQFWDAQSAMRIDSVDDETQQHFTAVLMPQRGEVKGTPFEPVSEPVVSQMAAD